MALMFLNDSLKMRIRVCHKKAALQKPKSYGFGNDQNPHLFWAYDSNIYITDLPESYKIT